MDPRSDEIKQIPKGYRIRNYHDENGKPILPWSEIKRIARIKADGIKKKRGQYIGKSMDIEYILVECHN